MWLQTDLHRDTPNGHIFRKGLVHSLSLQLRPPEPAQATQPLPQGLPTPSSTPGTIGEPPPPVAEYF